jgi:hypothetical protein
MENWQLIPCKDINRILKARTDLEKFEKSLYPTLLTISHKYASSDDIAFPEPATLAFMANFEQNFLLGYQNGIYTAQDINSGVLDIHIYVKDYENSIFEIIKFLNQNPRLHFEFKVTPDPKWNIITKLSSKA